MSGSRPQGDGSAGLIVFAGIVACAAAAWLPVAMADPPGYTGGGPLAVGIGLLKGEITWTGECTVWLIAQFAAMAGLTAAAVAGWKWLRRRRTRVDSATRSMAKAKDIAHLTGRKAAAAALRLQPRLAGQSVTPDHIGPALMRRVGADGKGRELIHASMEDVVIVIAGPRTGKTLTLAIPIASAHRGPCVITSNKRDVLDATRGIRQSLALNGVWVFDPQQLALTPQGWWFNPLKGCELNENAERVAGIFSAADRPAGAKVDAHFDTSARELIAYLLQAATVGGRPITDAYRWSMDSEADDPEPVALLTGAGMDLPARSLLSKYREPDKMRGSTFGTARTMLACVANPSVNTWITPQPGMVEFDPDRFVASEADTLYLLSQGGPGSPAPLLAVLNDALTEAGKRRARAMGGRLDPPVVTVADEVANLVRDPDLPRKVSYYGSMGMPLVIILQTYAQAEGVWGKAGIDAMWGAANHVVYLGGAKDDQWLERVSRLIGEHDVWVRSTSTPRGGMGQGGTVSHSTRRQRIMAVSDLAALPVGRAVLVATGAPPVLGQTLPWTTGPHAAAIHASITAHTPPPLPHGAAVAAQPGPLVSGEVPGRDTWRQPT